MKVKVNSLILTGELDMENKKLLVGEKTYDVVKVQEYPNWKRMAFLVVNIIGIAVVATSAIRNAFSDMNILMLSLYMMVIYFLIIGSVYQIMGFRFRSFWKVNGLPVYLEKGETTEENFLRSLVGKPA